jgi:hypothetical protein
MAKGTFKKVGKSNKRMYGPRGLLVCGLSPDDHQPFLTLLEQSGFKDFSVIFATDNDSSKTLKELFASKDRQGLGNQSEMRRAIIMSGLTQKELHKLMGVYRRAELPSQLWATLTPISENWSITHVLDELAAESEAIKKQREGPKRPIHK